MPRPSPAVSKPPRTPAILAIMICAGTLAAEPSAPAESITAPAHRAHASPSALSSDPPAPRHTIASLSITSADPDVSVIPEQSQDDAGATNFRGEKVVAAPVRYVQDFESGEIGPEWGAFGGTVADEHLTTFANPMSGLVLNVKTESDSAYEIRLDLYLIPAGAEDDESSNNILSVFVDDQPVTQLTPKALRKLSGKSPEPGQPFTRTIRIPFTAAHQIAELRFESGDPGAGPTWGIDNLVIDLGLQDPVYGVSGGESYDPASLGLLDPGAGLTGELQPLPKSRYGSNEPFAGDGPSYTDGSRPTYDPVDEDENDDGIDDEIEEDLERPDDRTVPTPPAALLLLAAAVVPRRRRS